MSEPTQSDFLSNRVVYLEDKVAELERRLEKAELVCKLVEHWDDKVDCSPPHISDAVKAWRKEVGGE